MNFKVVHGKEKEHERGPPILGGSGDGPTRFTLDKSVNLAMVSVILVQAGAFIWYSGSLAARVDNLEDKARLLSTINDKVIRLETRVDAAVDGISEIKTMLIGRADAAGKKG